MSCTQADGRGPSKTPSRASQIGTFFGALSLSDVPERVREQCGLMLLDFLACLMAGAKTEIGRVSDRLIDVLAGQSEVSVPTRAERVGLLAGAYLNARTANSLDFDETFPVGVHFGVGAATAAFALCERNSLPRDDLLLSTIAGYEVGGRFASAIGPMILMEDGKVTGFPVTWGVAGPVAAAAAAASAKALQLRADLFAQSIVIAAANSPLPAGAKWSSATDLPNSKYCDAGWCTVGGIFGSFAASSGSVGFLDLLDGDDGLTRMVSAAHPDPSAFTAGLGSTWMLDDLTFKPWPCCRFMHPALTALRALIGERPSDISRITRIVVKTNPLANSSRFRNPNPRTFASVQFSYPHVVAMLLLGIEPGPAWFAPELMAREDVRRIKAMVGFDLHPRSGALGRSVVGNQMRSMPGGVAWEVDGHWIERDSDSAAGDPWDEATRYGRDAITKKFLTLVRHPQAEQVAACVLGESPSQDLKPVFELIRDSARETNDA
jgi:2-methylcitrate dehydratase PrpD